MEHNTEIREVEDTIIDYNEWVSYQSNIKTLAAMPELIDLTAAEYLKECFVGYMKGPVGLFKGVPITAKSKIFNNDLDGILEAKKYLNEHKEIDDLFLYQVLFIPSVLQTRVFDNDTFEFKTLSTPVMSKSGWKIRYASLNDRTHQNPLMKIEEMKKEFEEFTDMSRILQRCGSARKRT